MFPTSNAAATKRIAALDAVVSELESVEQQQRELDARRVSLMSAALDIALEERRPTHSDLPYRALRAELATALSRSEHAVEAELNVAHQLTQRFPGTLAELEGGAISLAHARVIAEASAPIGPSPDAQTKARRTAYEHEVLVEARTETANRLRPIAQRIAARHTETTPSEQHEEALKMRSVRVIDLEDGMSDLIARLPSLEAHAIHDRLTRLAKQAEAAAAAAVPATPSTPSDSAPVSSSHVAGRSSRDAVRADALIDLLLASNPTALFAGAPSEAVRGHVQLVVSPATVSSPVPDCEGSLASPIHDVELVGYGPLAPRAATAVAAHTETWQQLSVNPESGAVLAVDRYRPSAEMQRLLGGRDLHCRFPGCRRPLANCDLDHTIDAALGGATATNNLAHLCREHHVLKHQTDWSVEQLPNGNLEWRSPTGRTHVDRPPSRVRFTRQAASEGPPSDPDSGSPPAMSVAPDILDS